MLVARREDRLRELAAAITRRHGRNVTVIACDLAGEEAPRALYEQTRALGTTVDILINSAGSDCMGRP